MSICGRIQNRSRIADDSVPGPGPTRTAFLCHRRERRRHPGDVRVEGARTIGHQFVTDNHQGISEAETTTELLPDRRLTSAAKYLQDRKWVGGRCAICTEAPDAQIIFRYLIEPLTAQDC